MSRPKLAIDIDDVLSQTTAYALSEIKIQHAVDLQYADIINHNWATLHEFPIDAETMFIFWDLLVQDDKAIENILPVEGVVAAISALSIHYELHVITARKDSTQQATEIWLKRIPCYLLPRPWNLLRTETHPLVLRRESWEQITTSLTDITNIQKWKFS